MHILINTYIFKIKMLIIGILGLTGKFDTSLWRTNNSGQLVDRTASYSN